MKRAVKAANPTRSREMLHLLSEQWMIRRLGQHGRHIDGGVTTAEERQERMRAAIRAVGPRVVVGRGQEGRPMTYEQAFERLYRVPFEREDHAA